MSEAETTSATEAEPTPENTILALDRADLLCVALEFEQAYEELQARAFQAEDLPSTSEYLAFVQNALKELEEERQALVRPLIDDKITIDACYREASVPARKVKALLEAKIAELQLSARQAQEALQLQAQAAAAAGDSAGCLAALDAVAEDLKVEGTRTTYYWAFEIVDKAAVPEVHKVVDEASIKRVAATHKGAEPPSIPGVKFTRAAKTAPTGRRSK